MPITQVNFGSGGIREVGDARVYLRAHWADEWELQPYLQVVEVVWSCAPTLPTATLLWRYGSVRQINLPAYAGFPKKSFVNRLFVKLVVDTDRAADGSWNTKAWYGTVEFDDDSMWGSVFRGENVIASGEQLLTCYGLEKLLADHKIMSSWWDNDGTAVETSREIVFNRGGRGNRTAGTMGWGGHVFEPDLESAELWSSFDIVNYLLNYQVPTDRGGNTLVPFRIALENDIPNWDTPQIEQVEATTYSLLERLVNRSRLLLWWLEVDETTEPLDFVRLHTNTLIDSDLSVPLPTGDKIGANRTQLHLIFDRDQLTSAAVRASDVQRVDQVVARGARRRSVGSWSIVDGTLEPGWANADETAYEAGASGAAGYAALNVKDQQKLNRDARNATKLEKVFSFFRIPATWDRRVKDGEGGDPWALFPSDAAISDPSGEPVYFADLAIEQTMPLYAGIDYSGDRIKTGAVTEPRVDLEEIGPIVVFKRPENSKWVTGEGIGDTVELEESDGDANNRFSVSIHVPRGSRGLFLRVHGAPGQHAIATSAFTRLPVDEYPGGYDYAYSKMIVTFSLEDDRYCEGRWPADAPAGVDCVRRYLIDAGDGYRKDYVAPGTVVGIDKDGSLLRSTLGGYLPKPGPNDDERKLIAVAKVAAAWYTVTRYVLSLETKRLRTDVGLGNLIVRIGDPAVAGGHQKYINSPVTQIAMAFPKAGGDPIMSLQTWAGELDPMQLMPNLPTVRSLASASSAPPEFLPVAQRGL